MATSIGLTQVGLANEVEARERTAVLGHSVAMTGRKMRKATEEKWPTATGPQLPSPSFPAQTVEAPDAAVKPAKPDELAAGVSTCSHLISASTLKSPENRAMETRGKMRAFLFKVWNQRFQLKAKPFNPINSSLKQENIKKKLNLRRFTDKPSGGSGSNSEPVKKEEN